MNYLLIHKARDHGIPSYIKALNLCENRISEKATWDQLQSAGLRKDVIESLKLAYGYLYLIIRRVNSYTKSFNIYY